MLIKKRRDEQGGVIVFVALLIVPLLGLAAFAVDWGHLLQVRWILQSAVDAGAQSARAYSQTGVAWGEAWLKAMAGAYEVTRENIRKNGIRDFKVWTEREGTQLKVYAEATVEPMFARVLGLRTLLVRARGQTTITPSETAGPQESPGISGFPTMSPPTARKGVERETFRERERQIISASPAIPPRNNPPQGGSSQPPGPSTSSGSDGGNNQPPDAGNSSPQSSSQDIDDWAYVGSNFVFIREQKDQQVNYLGLDRSTGEVQRLRGQVNSAPVSSGSFPQKSSLDSMWYAE